MDNIDKAVEEYIKARYKDLVHNNNLLKEELAEEKQSRQEAKLAYKQLLKYIEVSIQNVKDSVSDDEINKIVNNLIPLIAENYITIPQDGFTEKELSELNKRVKEYRNEHDLINLNDFFNAE